MKVVIQRVKSATVSVDEDFIASIGKGVVVFLGVGKGDDEEDCEYLVGKIPHLRIFQDEEEKFNFSLMDVGGEILVVSQFTLFGDCRKGRRPSFTEAADPEYARKLYDYFVSRLREKGLRVQAGRFQAMMMVSLVNEGPVTLLLDSKKTF
ncbi:MAG: D-tyrosyl-tRNA(Tyr) deacylase [Syntrophobacterales bacterium]|nr:MAG: D-tyrosyl-tRNA(Tyr) deacylase [Syntrophobacterales bacterium]